MTPPPALDGETLLLSMTRHLLTHTTTEALTCEGLAFIADALGADLAMLHLENPHTGQFDLAAHVGQHPHIERQRVQHLVPAWRERLLAGDWQSERLPNAWDGPPELDYAHFGAQHLVCFGLHSGTRLLGYVGLLFNTLRPDLDGLNVLGALGALWGTLFERLGAEGALRAREAMLRSVTDNGLDIITVLSATGSIQYQSASVQQMIGMAADAMLHQSVFAYIHPEDLPHVQARFHAVGTRPGDRHDSVTFRFRHAQGHYVWMEASARNLLHDPDVRGIVVHSRDITERQRIQAALVARVQDLTALHSASQALAGATTAEEIAGTVVQLTKERLQHEFVAVLRVEDDGTVMALHVDDAFARMLGRPLSELRMQPGEGLVGACIAQGVPIRVDDVHADTRYVNYHPAVNSELIVPIRVHSRVWGVLLVESSARAAFTVQDQQALETIAAQAGTALTNAMLLDAVRTSHEDLQAAYDKTIAGWARALDFRDHETEGHSQRVTELAVALARRFGFDDEALLHIRRGALLHDIGKMGVPDHVLLKPGPLDTDEWAIMKRHPDIAVEMLEPIAFLGPALCIPHAHHERWDGSGYPRGLRGTDIPLAARIFAVVDVWDALRSDRPYRPAWSETRARGYLAEQAGKQFDPQVVDAFLALLCERTSAELPIAAS